MHILGQKFSLISLGLSQKKKEIEKWLLRTSLQCIHLLLPVLVYGLDIILTKPGLMEKLERTNIQFIKNILSLPVTVADPVVYIIPGAIPIEGFIHKRALVLFDSFCRWGEEFIEKWLICRQFTVKSLWSCGHYFSIMIF